MTADSPLLLVDELDAYVSERADRCRKILAAGVEALRPPKADPYQPLKPRLPGEPQRWCAGWREPHMLTDLRAMPLDNWPPKRDLEFEARLDAHIARNRVVDLIEQDGEWREAVA